MKTPVACFILLVCATACGRQMNDSSPQCILPSQATSWPSDPSTLSPAPWPDSTPFVAQAHPPFPLMTARGPSLPNLRLVTIVTRGDPLRDVLLAFSDALVLSGWLGKVGADYGVATIGVSIHLDGPPLDEDVSIGGMRTYVGDALAAADPQANPSPQPDGSTVYLLYLPPGVDAVLGGQRNCDCSRVGGAHDRLNSRGDAIAYVQRCTQTQNDYLTRIASHEVAESMTDALPGSGYLLERATPAWSGSAWAAIQGGAAEVGDLCAGTRYDEAGWTYQRIWSNSAASASGDPCVPALPMPYFNTSAAQDWYPATAGASVDIPVTAWATGARPDWYVYATVMAPPTSGFRANVATANQETVEGTGYSAINNGGSATLTVTVAPGVAAGGYATIKIISRAAELGGDVSHFWPVGVYIP